jgi:hypothetical protein
MNEHDARAALDDAIHTYSNTFDQNGAVGAWTLIYERSALFPEDKNQPIKYAMSYVASPGTSPATAAGLLHVGAHLVENAAVAGMEDNPE